MATTPAFEPQCGYEELAAQLGGIVSHRGEKVDCEVGGQLLERSDLVVPGSKGEKAREGGRTREKV